MLTMIAAMDRHGAIGHRNRLLWSLPADMAHFKASTTGKTIVMGSVTAKGLGRALPKRLNLVLTSQDEAPYPKQIALRHVNEVMAFQISHPDEEIMVIGGAQVYRDMLPYMDSLLLTHVDDDVVEADAFFPLAAMRAAGWEVVETLLDHPIDDRHAKAFKVCRYRRKGV